MPDDESAPSSPDKSAAAPTSKPDRGDDYAVDPRNVLRRARVRRRRSPDGAELPRLSRYRAPATIPAPYVLSAAGNVSVFHFDYSPSSRPGDDDDGSIPDGIAEPPPPATSRFAVCGTRLDAPVRRDETEAVANGLRLCRRCAQIGRKEYG